MFFSNFFDIYFGPRLLSVARKKFSYNGFPQRTPSFASFFWTARRRYVRLNLTRNCKIITREWPLKDCRQKSKWQSSAKVWRWFLQKNARKHGGARRWFVFYFTIASRTIGLFSYSCSSVRTLSWPGSRQIRTLSQEHTASSSFLSKGCANFCTLYKWVSRTDRCDIGEDYGTGKMTRAAKKGQKAKKVKPVEVPDWRLLVRSEKRT